MIITSRTVITNLGVYCIQQEAVLNSNVVKSFYYLFITCKFCRVKALNSEIRKLAAKQTILSICAERFMNMQHSKDINRKTKKSGKSE